jgi:arylsulfatase A-like enzyme
MRTIACSAALATVCSIIATPIPAQERPALVVLITVDQLRPDYLTRWESQFTGGLRRILREGAFFENGYQDHAATETAPGHASTLSGRFPISTGILFNGEGVNARQASALVEYPGTGASPFRFMGTTLADWMQSRDPATRVLSVSRKDRGAILPVGRSPAHTVLWYTGNAGRFTTSEWYGSTLPAWVRAFNDERGVMRLAGRSWELLLPPAAYAAEDTSPGARRADSGFPKPLPADSAAAVSVIQRFPWIDSLAVELALRGVRAMDLGARQGGPDLLAVSLSALDGIGHRWGPDSREVHDAVLRIDRYLGMLIDSLYAQRGAGRVIVALTSDHGVTAVPEVRSTFDDNSAARRVPTAAFRAPLAAARAALRNAGVDATAVRWGSRILWLDPARVPAGFDGESVGRAFSASAAAIPGVMRAELLSETAARNTAQDAIARRWTRMFAPGVPAPNGDIALATVTLDPHNYMGSGSDATHGSPHDYDARVPVAFLGAPFTSGKLGSKVNVVDIGPTLAAVLGVAPTERVDGRVLREVVR